MKSTPIVLAGIILSLLAFNPSALAIVEGQVQQLVNLESQPVDTAASPSGKYIYVLTDQAEVLVYTTGGRYEGKIAVGPHVDRIEASPVEGTLFLSSRSQQTVELLNIDFVFAIDIQGSPFKGAADAPVVIAEFSEFE